MFTATAVARRSNGGWTCEPPVIVTSAAAGERTDTQPASGSGVRVKRNAARQIKK
jgi:hypothetical protein